MLRYLKICCIFTEQDFIVLIHQLSYVVAILLPDLFTDAFLFGMVVIDTVIWPHCNAWFEFLFLQNAKLKNIDKNIEKTNVK